MTEHHIAGSEAFRPKAHILVRRHRRRQAAMPVFTMYASFFAGGIGAGLIDMAIGGPWALIACLAGALLIWFRLP